MSDAVETEEAQTPIDVQAAPPPDRPSPSDRTMRFVEKWWKETDNVPEYEDACRTARENLKTLTPSRFDPKDPHKGQVSTEMRTREDDRRVRTPLAYLNLQQTIAMTVPEEHRAVWKPIETVAQAIGGAELGGGDPNLKRFSKTLEVVCREYLREVGAQETVENWVQDAGSFPLAVLKVTFSRELAQDAISQRGEMDEQDNRARIRVIGEDVARGVVTETDPQMLELKNLLEGIGGKSELTLWEGVLLENLPLQAFRFARNVTALENIYQAEWMSHDVEFMTEEIRERYAFQMNEDGTWTGVHPDDLDAAATGNRRGTKDHARQLREIRRKPKSNRLGYENPDTDKDAKKRSLLVREVWSRKDNKVYVFIEGVPYPVHQWTPERTPRQWYPFVIVVLNRLFGQVYGISDVELMADEQNRINRKRSDEEKARWDSLPRHYYNSMMVDEAEAKKGFANPPPFSWTPIKLGQEGFQSNTHTFQATFDPKAFDTSMDMHNLQRAASLPQQALGVTGEADFAEEVKVASEGATISANFRQKRIRRGLERLYEVVADLLLWELSPEAAAEIGGEGTLWPKIYGDAEAKQAMQQIKQQAMQQVLPQLAQQAQALRGPDGQLPADQVQMLLDQMTAPLIAKACEDRFGFPEPLTREALYRRLRVSVRVPLDGQLDRQQRMATMLKVITALGEAAQACQMAGTQLNIGPFLRRVANLLGEDDDITEDMFSQSPNSAAQALLSAVTKGQQLAPPLAAALVQVLMPALQQAAQQQGAPSPQGGTPPPPGAAPAAAGPAPASPPAQAAA